MKNLIFTFLAWVVSAMVSASVFAETPALKPIDQYYAHASASEWAEALPIIRSLVEADPSMPSRWFQYGTCLEALELYPGAISAFKSAYELDSTDYGAQYRIFKNYALAGDTAGFVAFAREEVLKTPHIVELIAQRQEFQEITSSDAYQQFLSQL
ncbi:hypothetical protein Q8A57_01195 [Porticoccus litoralis]|uniref:Tetratricopeptide repeat protein n=1 Tax=Porticoccus litoralis TaxID=434086 RepID=A0AAW8B385_9GAMM|nr:hypothetical protein [Porticoccus litoralis]MDP1519583.1 hypothetical protein [Porticoccus litoralis]